MPGIILEFDRVTKQFGSTVAADALSLAVQEGEFFTFLGPSGSGKSTLLRMVAGLENPDRGTIRIDGQDVAVVGPWHRNLGMMFQNYAVFPHMNVRLNVGYGLKVRRVPPSEVKRRVDAMLELVGLSSLGDKDVTLLSGGEQQRVALARALAPEPRMLLLDEPLSALDEKIRRTMQTELKLVHQRTGTTFLYVTHDQEEALTLSDRIAVINRGQCIQCDAPERLYKRPRKRFVAEFFRGCNVLKAEPGDRRDGTMKYQLVGISIDVPLGDVQAPGRHLALRAENVHLGPFAGQQPCRLCTTLVETAFRGTVLDYRLALPDGQMLVATTTQHVQAAPGSVLEVGFSPEALIVLED